MHGYGLYHLHHDSSSGIERSSYIPPSHTSPPSTSSRHVYDSPNGSAFYDSQSSRSIPSGLADYTSTQDELMSKRKRRDEIEETNATTLSHMGLLEQYKLSNTDKIIVGRDVELKLRVTELEKTQISAILEAYKQAIKLVKAQGIPKSSEDINTTINLTELGVRRLIFFFKLISDFRNLDHDLMVKLLKKNMMNLIQIHVNKPKHSAKSM